MTLRRLLFTVVLTFSGLDAVAADEEIAIVVTTTPEITPDKLCLWADEFAKKPLIVRRGSELTFGCLLANGTTDDFILRWTNARLNVSSWELRRGANVHMSGGRASHSLGGPPPNYKVLFSSRGKRHMDSGNTLSVPFTAQVPDFVGSGTLEVRLWLVGFVGTTKRMATFTLTHTIPINVTK